MGRWIGWLRTMSPASVLLLAAALLAAQPAWWLIRSWSDPAYNPEGAGVALAVLALALWSYSSERQPGSEQNRRYAYVLLALSACVRLFGQLLRVNVIGALTLALDAYALATVAGLDQRRRAVSPFWLSVLFAFSLPLERAAQRVVGYGLQQISADGACAMLGWFTDGLQCLGTRILLGGQDLLVDLPCSGARGLTLSLTLFAALCALKRPSLPQAALGLGVALAGALLVNTLRIVVLALGLVHAPGIDLIDGFAHEALGVFALVLAAAPLALWAVRQPAPRQAPLRTVAVAAVPGPAAPIDPWAYDPQGLAGAATAARTPPQLRTRALAWLLLGFAIVAVSAPAHPVDVARSVDPPRTPPRLAGFAAQAQPLAPVEREYFGRYGGGASKASYGPYGLLLVSTSAPLRHLHAPDECLRGSGHRVHYRGLAQAALPTALYRTTDAYGRDWRVAVSYVSDRGEIAASVAEAVWRWLRAPGSTWTMVQRIAPWDADESERAAWDDALLRALDLPVAPTRVFHRVADAR